MHRHVERELTRARLGAGATQAAASVRDVAERVINVVRRTPAGLDLNWCVDVPETLHARIDPDDLAEALGNLIENAAHYARSRIGVSAGRKGGEILVEIADDGPGIPQERVAEARTRGSRLDASSSGAGLGLAIVSEIMEAWEGSLSLQLGTPGLRACVRLQPLEAANDISAKDSTHQGDPRAPLRVPPFPNDEDATQARAQ
jgi:signal transduction histidine kinase